MGASENAAVVRRGYDAFGSGDMETLRELFAPDLAWHVNGRSRMAGTFRGVDAVLGNFADLAAGTGGTFRVEVHDLVASDDHVVVLGRGSGERNGRRLDDNYCHVFHVRDGRIAESWIVNQDPYAQDEFWAD